MELCLISEESRVREYLHNSTKELLFKTIYSELIFNLRGDLLAKETGPCSLMSANSTPDLILMYTLFARAGTNAGSALEDIVKMFGSHVKELGDAIVDKKSEASNAETKENSYI